MKKILTTGLTDNTQVQFEKNLKLVEPDICITHVDYPANFVKKVKEESPDILVIRLVNEKNEFIDSIRQIKSDTLSEFISIVILFDENDFIGNPDELLKSCDGLLSLPVKKWEVLALFRLLIRDKQKKVINPALTNVSDNGNIQVNLMSGEEQFRSIIEGAPDPIFIQAEMKFAYLNNAACRLFGINSASELIDKPVMERFHPDFHEKIKYRIHHINDLKQSVPELFEQKFIRMDGSEVWVETSGEPVNYEGKSGAIVFVRDISNRKKSEILLKESEERWQFALEGSGQGVWDWDLTNNKLFFSNQWKLMLGYQPDEVKNELVEWESRVHPDDLAKAYEDVRKHLNGETLVYQNEHRLRCKDGTYRWIKDRGKVFSYDENGKPARFIGVHTDINDLKESEKALMESENRFRSTLDSMFEGCQIIGFDWNYIYLNEAAVKQSHHNKDDLTGKNFVEMWPGIEKSELLKKMKRCMKKRVSVHMENLFNYPDGSKGWFELSIQPVPEGIFILSMDITERKMVEEKLFKLKDNLEIEVVQKTKELRERISELERFQEATIEREFRIKELRDEIDKLKK